MFVLALALGGSALVATPGGPGAVAPTPPPGGGWSLAFSDEFDGTSLSTDKWHTCLWWATDTCSIETNRELELYTRHNVEQTGNGRLNLQARRESAVAWNGNTYDYTSGMISTGGRQGVKPPGFVFTYGYVEARVKVPAGQGLWPALWLLPADYGHPPEIDAMEILGHRPNQMHMSYHYEDPGGAHAKWGTSWTGPDFSAGWHIFAVDWQPGALIWYVDGVERARYTEASVTAEPAYVLLNLAVGGAWPGSPNSATPFPSDYLVDYVRVWQISPESAEAKVVDPPTLHSAPLVVED
jgi:beta-glucanase (GH16 family)